jgi:hypothetical protein
MIEKTNHESKENIEIKHVRFANESIHYPIPVDMNKFKFEKEYDDEVFGWYEDSFIAIKKSKNV